MKIALINRQSSTFPNQKEYYDYLRLKKIPFYAYKSIPLTQNYEKILSENDFPTNVSEEDIHNVFFFTEDLGKVIEDNLVFGKILCRYYSFQFDLDKLRTDPDFVEIVKNNPEYQIVEIPDGERYCIIQTFEPFREVILREKDISWKCAGI